METLIYILSAIIFLIAMSLFAFMKYRDYLFNKLTIDQVKERLRGSRKLLYHICLDESKVNSKHANLLRTSISFLENRVQQLGGYNA